MGGYEYEPFVDERSQLEQSWEINPAETAAALVAAVVDARVSQVREAFIEPALKQAAEDRWVRNTGEAWNALERKYGGPRSPGGFDVREYKTQLIDYLGEHPHEFPQTVVDDPQRLAEKFEQIALGERHRFNAERDAKEFAAIKAASSDAYGDSMSRRDAGAQS